MSLSESIYLRRRTETNSNRNTFVTRVALLTGGLDTLAKSAHYSTTVEMEK